MKISSIPCSLSLPLYISYLGVVSSISENNPVTYEGLPLGCWQKEDYKKQWCEYPGSSSGASSPCRQEIITDPYNPENTCMRLTLPANTIGGSAGGMTADIDIKENYPTGQFASINPLWNGKQLFLNIRSCSKKTLTGAKVENCLV
ncbi:MAG: hypothetical protein LRY69_01345 [Gammaproteobacteria bacterium]|nr:hypothetical protein [Gammaproteobacteria bacterium]